MDEILGAGGYGLVVAAETRAVKLFYDTADKEAVRREAEIQETARILLEGVVRVPEVHAVRSFELYFGGARYLNGIEMSRIMPYHGARSQFHVLLGYSGGDLESIWGRDTSRASGPDNPPRGFFSSGVGVGLDLSAIAWKMGWGLRRLLGAGILPIDLEWVVGSEGELWLIDFGLCRFGLVDADDFLYLEGSEGLATDIYIPRAGSEHRGSFLLGWHADV